MKARSLELEGLFFIFCVTVLDFRMHKINIRIWNNRFVSVYQSSDERTGVTVVIQLQNCNKNIEIYH